MNSSGSEEKRDETVLFSTGCHWAMLLGPMLVIIIGGLAFRSQGWHAIALVCFGLIWGAYAYVSLQRSEIVLTRDRISAKAGFPRPKSYDIPLGTVAAIDFYQPSLGSMLGFGNLMVNRKGQKRIVIRFVSFPADFVLKTRDQLAALNQSPTDN